MKHVFSFALLGISSVLTAMAANVATLNTSETSVYNAGGFTYWTNHWTYTEFPTAPRTDNGQTAFVVSSGALDLNAWGGVNSPFPEHSSFVNAGIRGGFRSNLDMRTFYGKSLTLDGGQLITPNFSRYDETHESFEKGTDYCAFYTAFFANEGLILKCGTIANNWYANASGFEILGGNVTVDTPTGRYIECRSGTSDTNESHTVCLRFLGEVSGTRGDIRVVQVEGQTAFALGMTNAVKYLGDISVGGKKGLGYVELNASRLRALTVTNGATFRITGDVGGNTVGDLIAENAVVEFSRAEAAFTVTNCFRQTGVLTLDASALPTTGANGSQITLLTLADEVEESFDPTQVTVKAPAGWSSFKQARSIGLYRSQIDVPFNVETKESTAVDMMALTAETWARFDKPVRVALAASIPVPFHKEMKLHVATFPAALEVTAADFVDASAKTYGLPTTCFEVEDDGNGGSKLSMVARSVVQARQIEGHTGSYYFVDDASIWSDGLVPHPGADYLMVDFVGTNTNLYDSAKVMSRPFPGESLTLVNCEYYNWINGFTVDLRLYRMLTSNNQGFYIRAGSTFRGSIYVDESCSDSWLLKSNSSDAPVTLLAPIVGNRSVTLRYCWTGTGLGVFNLYGDNSQMTGSLRVVGAINTGKSTWNQMHVAVTNVAALGGPMPQSTKDGLNFQYFSKLIVNDDVFFDTTNRHLFARGGLRLEVAEGKTFSFLNEFRASSESGTSFDTYIPQRCGLEKTGRGTFALASRMIPCQGNSTTEVAPNGTNNFVRLVEGGLQPLAANVFDDLIVAFSNGTSVVVDPTLAATADYGLRLLNRIPIVAEGAKINLVLAKAPATEGVFTVNMLTVPHSTPDLTDSLAAPQMNIGGLTYTGRVQKEAVMVGEIPCTRYAVAYKPSGLMVIFR